MDPHKVYQLDLHGKKLTKIEGLDKFRLLRTLDVSCNSIRKLQNLDYNQELRELKVYGNEISVIEGLDRLTELCTLLLQHNKIACIGKGLSSLRSLRQLRLDHNLIQSVSPGELSPCSAHLSQLDLSHNQLSAVQGLNALTDLEELELAFNQLTLAPDLSRCYKLQELNLSGNPLNTSSLFSTLKSLQQLKILHLNSIHLQDVACLPRLKSLQELHLSHNHLISLEGIGVSAPSLQVLDVSCNDVTDINHLSHLQKLSSLTEILFEGNPVCDTHETFRCEVQKVLPNMEVIDGVASPLLSAIVSRTCQARPLTPSSIGPTLRQMEQHFLEAEFQLDRMEGEMAAMFELTRAKMAATLRGREEAAGEERVLEEEITGNELLNHLMNPREHSCLTSPREHSPLTELSYSTAAVESCNTVQNTTGHADQPDTAIPESKQSGIHASEHEPTSIASTPVSQDINSPCHGTTSRPPTRSGSRAKLTEALAFASVYSQTGQGN